jgi:hypothetical protein
MPLKPLLALPLGMSSENRVQEGVLNLADCLYLNVVLRGFLHLIPTGVSRVGGAVPLADLQPVDPPGRRLLLPGGVGGPVCRSLAAAAAFAAVFAVVAAGSGVGVCLFPPVVPGGRTRTPYQPICPSLALSSCFAAASLVLSLAASIAAGQSSCLISRMVKS